MLKNKIKFKKKNNEKKKKKNQQSNPVNRESTDLI